MRAVLILAFAALLAPCPGASEVPGAFLVLEVVAPPSPGRYPEAAPPRFALLEKGVVYAGGTSQLLSGKLESSEVKEIEGRVDRIRKLSGLGSSVTLGPGATRYRLVLSGKRPLEIVATGDPASAPPALQPLASLLMKLASFDHASLRLYRPESYALVAREGALPGGCRAWTFPFAPVDVGSGRAVPAAAAADWPTGALAASACAGDKRYVVTLRPLLPGERP